MVYRRMQMRICSQHEQGGFLIDGNLKHSIVSFIWASTLVLSSPKLQSNEKGSVVGRKSTDLFSGSLLIFNSEEDRPRPHFLWQSGIKIKKPVYRLKFLPNANKKGQFRLLKPVESIKVSDWSKRFIVQEFVARDLSPSSKASKNE